MLKVRKNYQFYAASEQMVGLVNLLKDATCQNPELPGEYRPKEAARHLLDSGELKALVSVVTSSRQLNLFEHVTVIGR